MRVSLKRRLQAHARVHGDGRVGPHVARAIELYLEAYAREGGGNGAGALPGDAEVEVTA
jgi:hypothetical protein